MDVANTHLRPGLCSVTCRALPAEAVARLAADSGLRAIEWGADVHAPPGDAARLARLRDTTVAHGLEVASYGSYFRAGRQSVEEFAPVLAAAVALSAPRIRVWAGALGSRDASADQVGDVVAQLRAVARWAADHGIQIGLEFHRGTLTDSVDSTLRLLDEVDRPNLATYWQPPVGAPVEEAVASLTALGDRVCALHVFSWWPDTHRLPLAERRDLWRRALAIADGVTTRGAGGAAGGAGGGTAAGTMDALLEFVPDDEPGLLAREAAALRSLIPQSRS